MCAAKKSAPGIGGVKRNYEDNYEFCDEDSEDGERCTRIVKVNSEGNERTIAHNDRPQLHMRFDVFRFISFI